MKYLPLLLAALVTACGSGSPPSSAPSHQPTPGAGVVAGKLVSQKSDGSDRAPIAGQVIGAFDQVVIPGKPVQHPPAPIMTAVTGADGGFEIRGLRPGRYFVVATSAHLGAAGEWATLTSRHGARVLLIRCVDCPGPL